MRAPALLRLALAGVALTSTAGLAAAAEETSGPLTLHFRNTGTSCSPGNPFLSTDKGDGKDINCGYIGGGLPFGEVLATAGENASRSFSTVLPEDVDPEDLPTFRLDDAQALAAKVVVQAGSQQGVPLPGTGQVRVVLELVGQTADGATVPLATGDRTVLATPPARTVEVPFSLDLPDAVGELDLVGVTATLTTRGVHAFHGFARMGDSTLTLPVLAEAAAQPAAGA